VIFIDASIPRTVADELKKVRDDVVFKHDIFLPGTDDPIWLRKVGIEGWLSITHDDGRIRTRPGERAAIMENGVGCFILTYRQDLQKPEIVRMVFDYLPEMERRFSSTPRPFIYTVTKNGHFTEYAQRRLRSS
jgi:PIN like domain